MNKSSLSLSIAALVCALVLPSSALAHGGHKHGWGVVKACKAERTDLGAQDFQAKYAPNSQRARRALANCVRGERKLRRQAFRQAVRDCRDERRTDRTAFLETYSKTSGAVTARHRKRAARRAFARCVRVKYKENREEQNASAPEPDQS
jgi:hypothetical protein